MVVPLDVILPLVESPQWGGAAMLAWMAEQERKMVVRRIKAGLAARKAKGKRLGRVPMAMATKGKALRLVAEGNKSYMEIAKLLKNSKGSVFNIVKANKEKVAEAS